MHQSKLSLTYRDCSTELSVCFSFFFIVFFLFYFFNLYNVMAPTLLPTTYRLLIANAKTSTYVDVLNFAAFSLPFIFYVYIYSFTLPLLCVACVSVLYRRICETRSMSLTLYICACVCVCIENNSNIFVCWCICWNLFSSNLNMYGFHCTTSLNKPMIGWKVIKSKKKKNFVGSYLSVNKNQCIHWNSNEINQNSIEYSIENGTFFFG